MLLILSVAPQGNQARFVVREQLAGAELPNDAVGVTTAISGKAVTRIHFGDFDLEQPRVAIVLNVVDDIKLEYDFTFVREMTGSP